MLPDDRRNLLMPRHKIERCAAQAAIQCCQGIAQVPHHAQFSLRQYLADLSGINVEMDQALRLWRKLFQVAGNAVIITSPKGKEQVGVVHRPVGHVKPVHPEHAIIIRMRTRQRGFAW